MNLAELRSCLDAVDAVLADEAQALERLDIGTIDACREKKIRLDGRLRDAIAQLPAPLADDERAEIRHRLTSIRDAARRNQLRLEAVYSAIKGLVGALSGTANATYGPPRKLRATAPVLASYVE
ncbi:MAG: hypothetical protein D6705_09645 [Deltaproteobacteria bacterium]|nr:MAG: hypothetical protein D6705_09645 [Deltaproteobacteria bacterium]